MPFALKALDASAIRRVGGSRKLRDYKEGYEEWRQAFLKGHAGVRHALKLPRPLNSFDKTVFFFEVTRHKIAHNLIRVHAFLSRSLRKPRLHVWCKLHFHSSSLRKIVSRLNGNLAGYALRYQRFGAGGTARASGETLLDLRGKYSAGFLFKAVLYGFKLA